MRCPDDERFAQYAEGKINGDERAEFLEHLSGCSECSILFAVAYGNGVCPDEESISALAEAELSQNRREALLKHIAVCKTCSAEYYYLRKLNFTETSVNKPVVKKRRIVHLFALAAMFLLLVGFTGVHRAFFKQTENNGIIADSPRIENEIHNRYTMQIGEMAMAPAPPPTRMSGMNKSNNRIAEAPAVNEMKIATPEMEQEIPLEVSYDKELDMAAYLGMFFAAFLAATLLPAQSEFVLGGLLVAGKQSAWILITVATIGNTLGSSVNWLLGAFFYRFRDRRWFPVKEAQLEKTVRWYHKYGRWSLLASWVPVIGDPLTLVAGVLHEPFWSFFVIVLFAKLVRYLFIAALAMPWIGN